MNSSRVRRRLTRRGLYNIIIIALIVVILVLIISLVLGDKGTAPTNTSPATSTTGLSSETVTPSVPSSPSDNNATATHNHSGVSDSEYQRRRQDILLVNLDHRLSNDYDADDLALINSIINTSAVRSRSDESEMDRTALNAANNMFLAAGRDGLSGFVITTAYRTYAFQHTLYMQEDEPVNEDGWYSVVPPFASEHRTGLAMDVTNEQLVNSPDTLTDQFGNSAQGKWLAEHCWEYGFIIRYPVTKSNITKIIFEPWHLRYVGVEHAMAMRDSGECLEEYLGYA